MEWGAGSRQQAADSKSIGKLENLEIGELVHLKTNFLVD
jgi:hypothetical protein